MLATPRPARPTHAGWPDNVTRARPIWFGNKHRPVFGWFHVPADGWARSGVVICPPLGFNYIHCHYALRLLAEELAAKGLCALRFDYDGTGDSAGGNDDPGRVTAWLGTIRYAVSLVQEAGAGEVSVVGLRFGATLAAEAAAIDGGLDQLVLWDPCASGRAFLREQRAISTITLGTASDSADGSVETPGVRYDATTANDIESISIDKCALPLARRVLLLTRDDRPVSRSLLRTSLAQEEFAHEKATGQAQFMDQYPPLQEHAAGRRRPDRRMAGRRLKTAARDRILIPETAARGMVTRGPSEARRRRVPVRIPPADLFGILTYRGGVACRVTDRPTAIFLNVANQHHVGPNRLWVEWSRQWALAGVRSLRLDLSGLGDSPDRQGQEGCWQCCKPEAFDDVADAARWLSPDDPSDVILVGLCSAAYQALESALAIRARGVVAINPVVSFAPPERLAGLPLDPRRRIAFPRADAVENFREAQTPHEPAAALPRLRLEAASHRPSGAKIGSNGSTLLCDRAQTRCWSAVMPSSGPSAKARRQGDSSAYKTRDDSVSSTCLVCSMTCSSRTTGAW